MAAASMRSHHRPSAAAAARNSTIQTCRGPPRLALLRARAAPAPLTNRAQQELSADVVIIGAGVIGLWTAYDALRRGASVALVDARRPCAGGASAQATGAGQGYLWLAHREAPSPDNPAAPSAASWHLAARGKRRWERLASAAADPVAAALGRRAELRRSGSLLLATNEEESAALEARAARLCAGGGVPESAVRVLATRAEVAADEPALAASSPALVRAALLVESDAQINGRGAALGLLDACRALGGEDGRFVEALEDGVAAISPSDAAATSSSSSGGGSSSSSSSSSVVGGARVDTLSGRRFRARAGVVVAAGAWTGGLLADALERASSLPSAAAPAAAWRAFFAPRRGHLLEVDASAAGLPAPLRRGVMELSYSRHYKHAGGDEDKGAGAAPAAADGEVTFTVTAAGPAGAARGPAPATLLVGSSREDGAGFDGRADGAVVASILARAAEFLPSMRPLAERAEAGAGAGGAAVRVGLRPWAAGGLPAVGPVPGLAGVVVAAGHEGSGLVMAPATAELALRWVGIGRLRTADEDEEDEEGGAWWWRAGAEDALLPARRLGAAAAAAANKTQ